MASSILIVEDHELVRLGLKSLIDSMELGDVAILEAGSLAEALQLYGENMATVQLVILDLNLPDSKGLSALQSFKKSYPAAPIIVLSGAAGASIAEEARLLGASHFLQKTTDLQFLSRFLAEKCQSNIMLGMASRAVRRQGESPPDRRMRLSPREVQILDLVLQGRSNQEIVDATALKLGTVKNYISGLLIIFGVPSRSKLISLLR
jgi:DNA-binding NarL/FixJ family response regulator